MEYLAVDRSRSTIAVAGSRLCWLLDNNGALTTDKPIKVGGRVRALAFDADPARLVVVHDEPGITLIDPRTGTIQRTIPHDADVRQVIVSDRNHQLVTIAGKTLRVLSLTSETGSELSRTFATPITRIALHPDVWMVAVVTEEPLVTLIDFDEDVDRWWSPLPAAAHDVAFSHDGDVLVVAGEGRIQFFRRRGDG